MRRNIHRGVTVLITVLCVMGMVGPAAAVGSGVETASKTAPGEPQPSLSDPAAGVTGVSDNPAESGVSTSEADSETSETKRLVKITYVNLETNEVHKFGPRPNLEVLPDGTYREVRTYNQDNRLLKETRRVEIESGSLQRLATTSDYEVTALHPHSDYGASYTPGSEVGLSFFATNETGTVGDVDLTVRIQTPDGTEETFSPTIGPDGAAELSYDTSGNPAGEYDVVVEAENGETGFADFVVGPQVRTVFPGIGDTTTVGSDVRATALVTENATPIPNTETTITIVGPDGQPERRTVTTNEAGFAVFTFTPQASGRYRVESEEVFTGFSAITAAEKAALIRINGGIFTGESRPGSTVSISGRLLDAAGPAPADLTVQLVRDPFGDEEVITNASATADETGTFYTEVQAPSNVNNAEFGVRLIPADGESIVTNFAQLEVQNESEQSGPLLEPDIDSSRRYALPGETVELSIDASVVGEQREPYANEELTIYPVLNFDERLDPFTVKTNSQGQATATYTIPSEIPDGSRVEFEVDADFSGPVDQPFADVEVQRFAFEDETEFSPSLNVENNLQYGVSVTDVATGEPVQDFPVMVAAERPDGRASVFDTALLRTNSAGEASIDDQVPADVSGRMHLGTYARYESPNVFPAIGIPGFEAELTGIDDFEYATGETISVTYSGPVDSTAVLGVTTSSPAAPTPLETARLDSGETMTFAIPSDAPQGTFYQVEGVATDSNGDVTTLDEFIEVQGTQDSGETNSPPTAGFEFAPTDPTVGETISFDAGASSDTDGVVSSYEWDFTGDGTVDATGETVDHTYDSSGTYAVSLTVTDDAGATDTAVKSLTVNESESGSTDGAVTRLNPEEISLSPNETTTVDVVVDNTGDVSAYGFNVTVEGAPGIQIQDIAPNGDPGTQDVTIESDGQQASTDAALANIGSADGATLGTITLSGAATGNATVSVNVTTLGDANGDPYSLADPQATAPVTVQAGQAGPGDVTGNGNSAADPDGDGVYEDINGDNSTDVLDVQALFSNLDSEGVARNSAFDINGDGSVDVLDVQALFTNL